MSPTPYRSSYMSSKKASTYGDSLVVGRKLGRHLPRIASGDADDDWEAEEPPPPPPPKEEPEAEVDFQSSTRLRLERRNARVVRELDVRATTPTSRAPDQLFDVRATTPTPRASEQRFLDSAGATIPRTPDRRSLDLNDTSTPRTPITPTPRTPTALPVTPTHATGSATGDDVAGIPGRLRLSRSNAASISKATAPLPSSKLTNRAGTGRWGLWADTQRHLLQAYEYLCHVGEAQQWIEGCLGEELGFGVVEMDEGLRNGVVLAKLCRVFQGEGVVRKIWDAPRLDFRHSDNINIFFNFVRGIGLPEASAALAADCYGF
jgi:Ras GTPase-activating-like protein IQGAP2/3